MGKIRNQALEDAAKVADAIGAQDIFEDHRGFCRATAGDIAKAIRTLKEIKQVGGGHRVGGLARMALMTPEERSAFARAGAFAMHAKKRACNTSRDGAG